MSKVASGETIGIEASLEADHPGNASGPGLDRRQALARLLGLVAAATAPAAVAFSSLSVSASQPLERARFVTLSAKLAQLPVKGGGTEDAVQAALAEAGDAERLARLADLIAATEPAALEGALAASDLKEIADRLLMLWYTGMTGTGDKQRVITHEDALAWRATGYAKAPGTCGEFGEWTAAPASAKAQEARR